MQELHHSIGKIEAECKAEPDEHFGAPQRAKEQDKEEQGREAKRLWVTDAAAASA
jgi:hypothetical protein